MRKEYDFSNAKRGPVIVPKGKTRITMYLDDVVLETFRKRAEKSGKGYQTLINEALKESMSKKVVALTADQVREIVREELASA
jgi:uncharacterized protein (DUF4415 family)